MPKEKAAKAKPLTEEEKLLRAEMLALQAEEERKRREEESKQRIKQRKAAEERYSKINSLKIHTQWRKFIRMAKVEELRKDIEILSQNHEREVDRKDAIIQMLEQDLEESEEQYQTALRSHLQMVDALIDLQYMRSKVLEEDFAANLRALEEEFESERAEIESNHVRQRKDMLDVLSAMEAEFKEKDNEARQDFESLREEIKNRNSEEYNVLKISLESTIEELERHFEQAHQAYLASTDARTQSFRELTERDASSARMIEKRMRTLIRLHDSLAHWRTKIASNSREWEARNKALRDERDTMGRHYQTLKRHMERFRTLQHERLKALSKASGAAIKALDIHLQAAAKIIKLAELNRKLETEQEKILPFFPLFGSVQNNEEEESSEPTTAEREGGGGIMDDIRASIQSDDGAFPEIMTPREGNELTLTTALDMASTTGGLAAQLAQKHTPPQDGSGSPKMSSYAEDEAGNQVEEWDYLTRFFKRFNKVLLDKVAIERERERLQEENVQLRTVLKLYLDGISVNEDVINDPANPLLIVNQRLQQQVGEIKKEKVRMALTEAHLSGPRSQAESQMHILQYAYSG